MTTFSKVRRETETMWTVAVYVDGVQVAEMIKDPTCGEFAAWYTHSSAVYLADGRVIELPDVEWDTRLADAKKWLRADIRGQLSAQPR